jgi:hypothetical protein
MVTEVIKGTRHPSPDVRYDLLLMSLVWIGLIFLPFDNIRPPKATYNFIIDLV